MPWEEGRKGGTPAHCHHLVCVAHLSHLHLSLLSLPTLFHRERQGLLHMKLLPLWQHCILHTCTHFAFTCRLVDSCGGLHHLYACVRTPFLHTCSSHTGSFSPFPFCGRLRFHLHTHYSRFPLHRSPYLHQLLLPAMPPRRISLGLCWFVQDSHYYVSFARTLLFVPVPLDLTHLGSFTWFAFILPAYLRTTAVVSSFTHFHCSGSS